MFEFLSNLVIRQVGVRHWLAFIIVCWGAVTTAMASVPTWQVLAGLRVLLGVFEVCWPSYLFYVRLVSFLVVCISSVAGTNDMRFRLDYLSSSCLVCLQPVSR